MRKIIFINIFLLLQVISFAQKEKRKGNDKLFAEYEDTLKVIANTIIHANSELEKRNANDAFIKNLKEVLQYEKSFRFPFDSLPPTISNLTAPDYSFRIFNWPLQKDNNSYEYYAIVH